MKTQLNAHACSFEIEQAITKSFNCERRGEYYVNGEVKVLPYGMFICADEIDKYPFVIMFIFISVFDERTKPMYSDVVGDFIEKYNAFLLFNSNDLFKNHSDAFFAAIREFSELLHTR